MNLKLLAAIVAGMLPLTACSRDDGGAKNGDGAPGSGVGPGSGNLTDANAKAALEKQVLNDSAAQVVIPTYRELAKRAEALAAAVQSFGQAKTQDHLQALREAWIATRSPWEQGEAFLFGPVESNGYDSAIDSWPLNKTDLQAVMSAGVKLDEATIAARGNNEKGFHAVEYLIFGEQSNKTVEAFTAREIEYMLGAALNIRTIASNLAQSWESGVDGKPAFKTVLASAGDSGNSAFPSRSAALRQLVAGMANICHEVSRTKIATPFDAADPNLVESQFSYNSLKDFADNIRSVQNMYTASLPTAATHGTSLSSLVAKSDTDLDKKVLAKIDAAIAAIQKIPEPFPISLQDKANAKSIHAAQDSLNELELLLNDEVGKVVTR